MTETIVRNNIIYYTQMCRIFHKPNIIPNGDILHFLTLTMPNFLNGIIHLPFMELSIIILRDIKMKT